MRKKKPRLHLILNAHLDPVWQWRWEEGVAEAIATFRNAVAILAEHPDVIFNHNEALLYRWVETHDRGLFSRIKRLVRQGRWSISGGWYLQPDTNLPGLESLVRQVLEGRLYFWKKFRAWPKVAYNFDSFGHSGGLPQLLRLAGYRMYIHMRPQAHELSLPADLYRWRGVDGSEVLAYRICVGLYHTERDNLEDRLREATELALELNRDVPVFWGLGNHGGGATREDIQRIADFSRRERRVELLHSTPDRLYEALRTEGRRAPVVEGDIQRVFTGCYSSLARVKRRAEQSLGGLVQAEALRAMSWWLVDDAYPADTLGEAWRSHLLNDFHDILTGTCTEPAERDALDLYGSVETITRRCRLGAAVALARRFRPKASFPEGAIPIVILNANPSLCSVPVEVECLADYRPLPEGDWRLRVYDQEGAEVLCQEEQPEALLPFNDWRRKLCFWADLPGLGASFFMARAERGRHDWRKKEKGRRNKSYLKYKFDRKMGLIGWLDVGAGRSLVRGPLLEPLTVDDPGDSWGTGRWNYRQIKRRFGLIPQSFRVVARGPIRTITESGLSDGRNKIVFQTIAYPGWPVLEFRLRVHWEEERRMLKLAVPTALVASSVLVEVPGGAIHRPADGDEHVFGRWAVIRGKVAGREMALGIVACGPHGLDIDDGELRISLLRSAAYCHEQGFSLSAWPARKFMDLGLHEVRLLVTGGEPENVLDSVASLADWLSAPPFSLAHLPFDQASHSESGVVDSISCPDLLSLEPPSIRLTAAKLSVDQKALIGRFHETRGKKTRARLWLGHPRMEIPLSFEPFELKTIRVEKSGRWREVNFITEK